MAGRGGEGIGDPKIDCIRLGIGVEYRSNCANVADGERSLCWVPVVRIVDYSHVVWGAKKLGVVFCEQPLTCLILLSVRLQPPYVCHCDTVWQFQQYDRVRRLYDESFCPCIRTVGNGRHLMAVLRSE